MFRRGRLKGPFAGTADAIEQTPPHRMTKLGGEAMDAPAPATKAIPFDTAQLDRLLGEAGIDALLVTSKHNVQYLLGGYRFFFFDYMDAMGTSRYLPVLVYRRGRPEQAAYIGYRLRAVGDEVRKFLRARGQTAAARAGGG